MKAIETKAKNMNERIHARGLYIIDAQPRLWKDSMVKIRIQISLFSKNDDVHITYEAYIDIETNQYIDRDTSFQNERIIIWVSEIYM